MIIGNVGNEPRFSFTTSGKAKANLSLATTKKYRDANGEQKEITTWVSCACWGKIVDVVRTLVTKGTQLYIEGTLNNNTFTDSNGNRKTMTEVNVENIQVIGGFKGSNQSRSEEQPSYDDEEALF